QTKALSERGPGRRAGPSLELQVGVLAGGVEARARQGDVAALRAFPVPLPDAVGVEDVVEIGGAGGRTAAVQDPGGHVPAELEQRAGPAALAVDECAALVAGDPDTRVPELAGAGGAKSDGALVGRLGAR